MLETETGIFNVVNPEQPLKAEFGILYSVFGNDSDVIPEQPWNAYAPMLSTLLGILSDVIPEQRLFVAHIDNQ